MKKFAFGLAAFLVCYLALHGLAYGLGCWIFEHPPSGLAFSSKEWRSPPNFDTRYRMALDLEKTQVLKGKSRDELFSLLGLPTFPKDDALLTYDVPFFPDYSGQRVMLVFMKNDHVTAVGFDRICDTGPILFVKLCPFLYPHSNYNVCTNTYSMLKNLLFLPKTVVKT